MALFKINYYTNNNMEFSTGTSEGLYYGKNNYFPIVESLARPRRKFHIVFRIFILVVTSPFESRFIHLVKRQIY